MTHMFKKHQQSTSITNTTQASREASALGMHKDSRVISKVHHQQPKIRIIHIFAPEIIKTDVANFRELVQRLTGKPSTESNNNNNKGGRKGKDKEKKAVKRASQQLVGGDMIGYGDMSNVNTKLEVMMGAAGSPSSSSDHQLDHINNTSGGYLTAFTDIDDSFDFSSVFQLGSADTPSHLNAFGDHGTQLSFRG